MGYHEHSTSTGYFMLCLIFFLDTNDIARHGGNDNIKCILEKSLVVTLTTTHLEFAWDDVLQICTAWNVIYLQQIGM